MALLSRVLKSIWIILRLLRVPRHKLNNVTFCFLFLVLTIFTLAWRRSAVYWYVPSSSLHTANDIARWNATLRTALSVAPEKCTPFAHSWRAPLERFVRRHFIALNASGHRYTATAFRSELGTAFLEVRVPIAIVGGKVYAGYSRANVLHPWLRIMLSHLERASRTVSPLPDSFFVLSASDWPRFPINGQGPPQTLSLGVSVDDDHWDIGVPAGQFDDEYDAEIEAATGHSSLPWRDRKHAAVWRGTLMCPQNNDCSVNCPRATMRLASVTAPDVLDVRISDHYPHQPGECKRIDVLMLAEDTAAPDRYKSRHEQAGYRFMLALDGNTYTAALKHELLSGSTVLRQRSPHVEFFGKELCQDAACYMSPPFILPLCVALQRQRCPMATKFYISIVTRQFFVKLLVSFELSLLQMNR